ncbi:PhyR family response regulator anti-anti-sigma factor [Hyphomonas sp.]|uniref:PhyR family response regulator anti-anti-sigma factor n=1 Tax=Hyphomonas sp. TaxID=87 RepID=UPI00391D5C90
MHTGNLSDTIETELPYLRRYARAILGNAFDGDRAVECLLEQVLESYPASICRVQLFRRLDQILASPKTSSQAVRTDARMAPLSRRAFLITAMEHFSEADAAVILGVSESDLVRHLETAHGELTGLEARRVLIVEDEPLIVGSLSILVESLGHKVAGVAVTADQAVTKALELRPDLILADILLADGSQGTDAVADIRSRLSVPVIFVTAFPERMLLGKSGEPTFLITKPFRPAQVKAVISQALFLQAIAA